MTTERWVIWVGKGELIIWTLEDHKDAVRALEELLNLERVIFHHAGIRRV